MVDQHAKRFWLPGDPTSGRHHDNGSSAEVAPAISEPAGGSNGSSRFAETPTEIPAPETSARQGHALPTMRIGCIGRGNAGKTALFRALADGPVGDFLPSGLHVDAVDPREVARMIRESEQTQRLLHMAGLPPTLVASQTRYHLYEGAEPRASYDLHEVIGQVLTHTLPDSAVDQQTLYDQYLANLVNTQVLWAVVPCPPPNPGSRERRRYANDLRITLAYLREAIRLRSLPQPAVVAVVLSKIDTLFSSVEDAQTVFTEQTLKRALGPLVDFIQACDRISEAAIIPVTAFGFGNATVKEGSQQREGSTSVPDDEAFGAEPIWVLRDGVDPLAFNLDSLFLWTLLYGMRSQEEVADRDLKIQRISDKLQSDLEAVDPWIVSLK